MNIRWVHSNYNVIRSKLHLKAIKTTDDNYPQQFGIFGSASFLLNTPSKLLPR